MKKGGELRFKGLPISEGIAIGALFLLPSDEEEIPMFSIAAHQVEKEITRYRRALFSSRDDLRKLQVDLASEGSLEAVEVFDTHLAMLEDPLMTIEMEDKIRQMRQNTEAVFYSTIGEYETRLSGQNSAFFRQRLVDVIDLSQRILRHLQPHRRDYFTVLPSEAILVAKELTPSQVAALDLRKVVGIITQEGGEHSHVALMARAKGVPYISQVDREQMACLAGKTVIINGATGEIIFDPQKGTVDRFLKQREKYRLRAEEELRSLSQETCTKDGKTITIQANIGTLEELKTPEFKQALGIGLFRTEYLLLERPRIVYSESEQREIYEQVLTQAAPHGVTFRVFDLGGDKAPALIKGRSTEINPLLGCRGIRYLLQHLEIFRIQLRALLLALKKKNGRLLIPMISDISEWQIAKQIIQEVAVDLFQEAGESWPLPHLGIMLEVPSALLTLDILLPEVDFVAIGTNDLVQYTLGVDRQNAKAPPYASALHPSILRFLRHARYYMNKYQKPGSVCGEITTSAIYLPILIGMGFDQISCSARYVASVKQNIGRWTVLECQNIFQHVYSCRSTEEITKYLLEISRSENFLL